MIVGVLLTIAGLAIGIPAYLGLWRSWTGPEGNNAWGLGALWVGIGGAAVLLGQVLPAGPPTSILVIVGGLVASFGICSCWWMVPPLRPRWYRAQYTPLVRRRGR